MFLPIRTDRTPRRRPLVTELIIVTNLLVYLLGVAGESFGWADGGEFQRRGAFVMSDFHAWQLVTYQFLHDAHGLGHLAFNMLFLWIYGPSVEDRFGRAGFLAFYIVGGAIAALVHGWSEPNVSLIGASGSIAALTGAFLALFPRSRIIIISIFGMFALPALWVIGFFFLLDLLRVVGNVFGAGGGNVAYLAHVAGYVFGFGLSFGLLAASVVPRGESDVFFLFKQSRRRAAFRAASRSDAAGLFESASADTGQRLEKATKKNPTLAADQQRVAELRAEIARCVEAANLPAAATVYRGLNAADADSVLPESIQAQVAAQLYTEGDYVLAARAFEALIRTYRAHDPSRHTHLLLASIYARHAPNPERAGELLDEITSRLDDAQRELAATLRSELGAT